MSKKKKPSPTSGLYALCITAGVIIGLGLTPLAGNLLIMVVTGAVGGTLVAFFISRRAPITKSKRRH